jgi:hypothetical protein
MVARAARVLSHYTAVFFGTSPPFLGQTTQDRVYFFNLLSKPYIFIKQALYKVAQSRLQQPEHTTKQSILNQRHGSILAYQ